MTHRAAWLLPVLALAGCGDAAPQTGRSAAAIAGASTPADAPLDRAVVAIVRKSGPLLCTGTLITPRVVLTAAHCPIGPKNYSQFDVFFGADVKGAGARIEVVDARPHPQFEAATFANDIAVLFLRDEAPIAPRGWRTTPFDATEIGADVRVVGYGRTRFDLDDAGVRRQGNTKLAELAQKELKLAGGAAQPCGYDSGGPAFMTLGGVELLVGVTSRGDNECATYARMTRVDAHLDFVNGYLAETRAGSRALGAPCLYDGHCQSGSCLAAADEPRIRYCSAKCSTNAECGALECLAGACQKPRPTPGAPGGACATDDDCVEAECLPDSAGKKYCARACSPVNASCPNGLACTAVDTIRYACLRVPPAEEPESSCAIGRPSEHRDGFAGVALVLGVAALVRRVRRS